MPSIVPQALDPSKSFLYPLCVTRDAFGQSAVYRDETWTVSVFVGTVRAYS